MRNSKLLKLTAPLLLAGKTGVLDAYMGFVFIEAGLSPAGAITLAGLGTFTTALAGNGIGWALCPIFK